MDNLQKQKVYKGATETELATAQSCKNDVWTHSTPKVIASMHCPLLGVSSNCTVHLN